MATGLPSTSTGYSETVYIEVKQEIQENNMPCASAAFSSVNGEGDSEEREFKTEHEGGNIKGELLDFSNSSELIKQKTSHTGTLRFSCRYCEKMFGRVSALKEHERIHLNDRRYKCSICEKGFLSSSALSRHRRRHSEEKPYHCKICGKGCNFYRDLVKHERTHTGERPFQCRHCFKSFNEAYSLSIHERLHNEKKSFMCCHCGKCFVTAARAKRHEKTHNPPANRETYKCDECQVSLSSVKTLTRHKRELHSGGERFQCCYCDKKFVRNTQLKKHTETRHAGEIYCKCNQSHLKDEKVPKFKCDECGKNKLGHGQETQKADVDCSSGSTLSEHQENAFEFVSSYSAGRRMVKEESIVEDTFFQVN